MEGLVKWLMNKFFKSSKFWLAIAAMIATALHEKFGLDPEEVTNIVMAIVALIIGKGMADWGKNNRSGGGNPPPDKEG